MRGNQIFPESIEIHFLAATPETITPLLGLSKLVGLGSLRSRLACFREYYLKKGIRRAVSPVRVNRLASLFLDVSQLNLELLHANVRNVAQEFANIDVNDKFKEIFYLLSTNRNIKILIILPLPAHYGGNVNDDISISSYVKENYPLEEYFILVKNHPSDNESHQSFEKILGGSNFFYWHDLYERNLPIELISISFSDRVTLFSTGTTAMCTINAESSRIFWPSNLYACKLARNNYASIANYLGIEQKYINRRFADVS